jgi:hypothetical protein
MPVSTTLSSHKTHGESQLQQPQQRSGIRWGLLSHPSCIIISSSEFLPFRKCKSRFCHTCEGFRFRLQLPSPDIWASLNHTTKRTVPPCRTRATPYRHHPHPPPPAANTKRLSSAASGLVHRTRKVNAASARTAASTAISGS